MFHPPRVDDVLLSASVVVRVQQQVTVTSKELPIGGFIHSYLIASFHSPNLQISTDVAVTH